MSPQMPRPRGPPVIEHYPRSGLGCRSRVAASFCCCAVGPGLSDFRLSRVLLLNTARPNLLQEPTTKWNRRAQNEACAATSMDRTTAPKRKRNQLRKQIGAGKHSASKHARPDYTPDQTYLRCRLRLGQRRRQLCVSRAHGREEQTRRPRALEVVPRERVVVHPHPAELCHLVDPEQRVRHILHTARRNTRRSN